MNRINNYLTTATLAIALLGCTMEMAEDTPETTARVRRLPVDVKVVAYASLVQEERVAGSILPNREVDVTGELARKVTSIHFADGSYVTKGQLLYKLDDSEIKARLKQVQAEVALAQLSEARLARLLRNESVRQEEYDVALTKLESLRATEELLQVELSRTSITAPFSGVAGITKVEVGSFVNPGSPLLKIQEQGTVKVQFTVSEKYISHLRKGKVIHFTVVGNPEKLSATITATESGVDMESRAITVHAATSNAHGTLRPGMSARVYFSIADDDATGITLPTESLIPGAAGYSVFAVHNGLARLTPVTIGDRNETDALITSGLNNGDTVMISNILRSGDGTPVEIASIK